MFKKKIILEIYLFVFGFIFCFYINKIDVFATSFMESDVIGDKIIDFENFSKSYDDCEASISKGTNGVVDYGSYRIYQPSNYENKPLMIVIPGACGQIEGSYNKVGLCTYITNGDYKPDFTVIFFYRPPGYSSVGYGNVRNTINKYDYNGTLYYCGVSMGANEFSGYCKNFDFDGAILVDGHGADFKDELSLKTVFVIQSTQRRFTEYQETLDVIKEYRDSIGDTKTHYEVVDLTESPSHDDSPWWALAPNDDAYFKYRRHDFKKSTENLLALFK